jgi:hypothetical protein
VCDKKEVNDKNIIKALKLQKRLFNIIDACCKIALLRFFDVNRNLEMIKFRNKIKIIAKLEVKS